MGTKNNPGVYDCFSRAEPDEPMFVLLGRDPLASALVEMWANARAAMGEDPEKVQEARDCSDAMARWARGLGKRPLQDKHLLALLLEQREGFDPPLAQVVKMIRGLVRHAELREPDEPGGKIWDDESREALALAREMGWGNGRTGRLP